MKKKKKGGAYLSSFLIQNAMNFVSLFHMLGFDFVGFFREGVRNGDMRHPM